MFRAALVIALGLFGISLPLSAQQSKHTKSVHHQVAEAAATPLGSNLSIYHAQVLNASHSSLLLHNGPVRAWSDGAQLVSETAFVQIGMAPLGLFPASYLAPDNVGPAPVRRQLAGSNSRPANLAGDGKDLPADVIDSPLSRVYYTGEVGFVYGRWSGKDSGDYVGSYIWGQAGTDKFQITAGASFDNWSGSSSKVRAYSFSR
jgi:hypothetical protein